MTNWRIIEPRPLKPIEVPDDPENMPPAFIKGFVDQDVGVELEPYKTIRVILDALYTALTTVENIAVAMGATEINFVMESGVVLRIWNATDGLCDFRLPQKHWIGVDVWYGTGHLVYLPLPEVVYNPDFTTWARQSLVIPGSDLWYYIDFDGQLRQGINCTPKRSYSIVSLIEDVRPMILIGSIIALLLLLHIPQAAIKFMSAVFRWNVTRVVKSTHDIVREINRKIGDMDLSNLDNIVNLGKEIRVILNNQDELSEKIGRVISLIGCRLAL